jgi:DNA polymerase III subunit gamma/tau
MLTNTAFNAMLKTLEEPPEYLKFVLATTDPQKVPVTVLSRCLQFNLRPMAPETVLEHLGHVLQQENISSEPQALRLLARAARGSMRDALSLTDQAIAFGGGQLQEAAVRQMLGSADRSHVFRLIEALAQGDGKSVVDTSEALRLNGLSAAATLEDMSMVLQRMAVLQAVPSMAEASDTDPEAAELKRLAAMLPADETQLLYSLCLHGRQELGLAPDEYAALTMVLLRLLAFKPQAAHAAPSASAEKKTLIEAPAQKSAAVSQPAQHVQPLPVRDMPKPAAPVRVSPQTQDAHAGSLQENHLHDHPDSQNHFQDHDHDSDAAVVAVPVREQVQINPQRDVQVVSAPTVVSTPEGDVWYEVVQQLVQAEVINALVRELALQSQLVARDSDTWMLRVERESLNSTTSRERLQAALTNAGHAVRLTVEVGRVMDSPAKRNAAAAAAKQEAAEALILNDPYVQTLMRDFGAKIVPGTIQPN